MKIIAKKKKKFFRVLGTAVAAVPWSAIDRRYPGHIRTIDLSARPWNRKTGNRLLIPIDGRRHKNNLIAVETKVGLRSITLRSVCHTRNLPRATTAFAAPVRDIHFFFVFYFSSRNYTTKSTANPFVYLRVGGGIFLFSPRNHNVSCGCGRTKKINKINTTTGTKTL